MSGSGPADPPGEEKPQGAPSVAAKVDEGWKAEAQREKERLEMKAEEEAVRRSLPPPTFPAFVSQLGFQAMMALGLLEAEKGKKPKVDLPMARYTIDVLGVLQEKTRGNLSPEEKGQMEDLLQSLRLHFARAAAMSSSKGRS